MAVLTEPQQRMLRVMWQNKLYIRVNIWWDGYWETMWTVSDRGGSYPVRRPNIRTMQCLERMGLLKREPGEVSDFHFVLTPKGKTAGSLQDAKD